MKKLLVVIHVILIFILVGCTKDLGVYVGELKKGTIENHQIEDRHGQGTLTFKNSNKYDGEFKDGKYHGKGTFTQSNGNKYDGGFKDGKQHGKGIFTWSNGNKHDGGFKDGKQHGKGIFTWSNGDKYVGEFKHGQKYGQGVLTYKNGKKFDGEWRWDKPFSGKGVFIGKNKKGTFIIEGEWINGQLEGQGKWAIESPSNFICSYEGEFKKSKPHGQGKMQICRETKTSMQRVPVLLKMKGLTIIGEMKNGRPWNARSYNDKGEQQPFIALNGKLSGM